jgi:hypothetical protein
MCTHSRLLHLGLAFGVERFSVATTTTCKPSTLVHTWPPNRRPASRQRTRSTPAGHCLQCRHPGWSLQLARSTATPATYPQHRLASSLAAAHQLTGEQTCFQGPRWMTTLTKHVGLRNTIMMAWWASRHTHDRHALVSKRFDRRHTSTSMTDPH